METKRDWSEFIGRSMASKIAISSDRINGLAALLDYAEPPWPNNHVPPTGHWLAMFPFTMQSKLGEDGHEKLGDFIPAIDYPRRMWVGGKINYLSFLSVNQIILHRSSISNIEDKIGKTGPMTFVTLMHEYLAGDELLLQEEQKIVYREASTEPAIRPTNKLGSNADIKKDCDWSRQIIPDTTLLFRYSAVSFNAHKIHFDHEYVNKEGYPGLLVHAPLTATLLIDLYQSENTNIKITSFEYKAQRPLYVKFDQEYKKEIKAAVESNFKDKEDGSVHLWAEDCSGAQAVTARLEIEK